jgi:hypothetical protein
MTNPEEGSGEECNNKNGVRELISDAALFTVLFASSRFLVPVF